MGIIDKHTNHPFIPKSCKRLTRLANKIHIQGIAIIIIYNSISSDTLVIIFGINIHKNVQKKLQANNQSDESFL